MQLDEIAAPILLAWRLHREGVWLGSFDPWVMILRAAGYLIRQGPVTAQERWEEWFADLSTEQCAAGSSIEFTFFWKQAGRWEGKNYSVVVPRKATSTAPSL
ncbi:MAG TPA: hypothetical protein VIM14_06640 [Polyangia bacterium]